FELGSASDVSATTLYRHGNYDTVHGAVIWDSAHSVHTLPPSLYLRAIPAWWPAGTAWPWGGPDKTPMIGTLPAQAGSDAVGRLRHGEHAEVVVGRRGGECLHAGRTRAEPRVAREPRGTGDATYAAIEARAANLELHREPRAGVVAGQLARVDVDRLEERV